MIPGAGLGRSGVEEILLAIGIRTADHPGCSVVALPAMLRVYCIMYIISKLVLFFVLRSVKYIFRIIRVFQLSVQPPSHHNLA